MLLSFLLYRIHFLQLFQSSSRSSRRWSLATTASLRQQGVWHDLCARRVGLPAGRLVEQGPARGAGRCCRPAGAGERCSQGLCNGAGSVLGPARECSLRQVCQGVPGLAMPARGAARWRRWLLRMKGPTERRSSGGGG